MKPQFSSHISAKTIAVKQPIESVGELPLAHADNTIPRERDGYVFVFGSNLAGIHGAGAAKVAKRNFGAMQGHAEGPMGMAYGIPTKDARLKVLPLHEVALAVAAFVAYAGDHPKQKFFVTRVGCGLAGFSDEQIAPMFANAPHNCSLAHEWLDCIADLDRKSEAKDCDRQRQVA